MTDTASRFWGGRDGKVGLLSGWHALIAGVVLGALSIWGRNWWTFSAMVILVVRAAIALWLARDAAHRPTAGDRADARRSADG